MVAPKALPNFVRKEARDVAPDLQMIDDLLAGSRTMWDKADTGSGVGSEGIPYIFRWEKEKPRVYQIRSKCESVFDALGRTLSAAVGLLFSKRLQVKWNGSDKALQEFWENADASGTAGPVLIKRFAEKALKQGIGAIVTDHPPQPAVGSTPLGVVTADVTAKLGLRPAWTLYSRAQITNWRHAKVNNLLTLTMIEFAESADVEEGDFGMHSVQRYRVLRLVNGQATWTLYELKPGTKGDADEDYTTIGEGFYANAKGQIADFLPVSIAYTGRTDAPLTSSIPLLGVAFASLALWQQSTDLRFYRMVSAYPQPLLKGELMKDSTGAAGEMGLGPLVGVHVTHDGDFLWREIEGKSMTQLELGIASKLTQIVAMGLSYVAGESKARETAEAKRIDATASNANLATGAQGIEDCGNTAWEHVCWYMGIPKVQVPTMTLNRAFENLTMDPTMLTAYVGAIVGAHLPVRVLAEAMVYGGLLPPETDIPALLLEMDVLAKAEAKATADEALAAAKTQAIINPPAPAKPRNMNLVRDPATKQVTGISEVP